MLKASGWCKCRVVGPYVSSQLNETVHIGMCNPYFETLTTPLRQALHPFHLPSSSPSTPSPLSSSLIFSINPNPNPSNLTKTYLLSSTESIYMLLSPCLFFLFRRYLLFPRSISQVSRFSLSQVWVLLPLSWFHKFLLGFLFCNTRISFLFFDFVSSSVFSFTTLGAWNVFFNFSSFFIKIFPLLISLCEILFSFLKIDFTLLYL